jgi:guanylate kinase
VPHLRLLSEFESAVQHYRLSPEAQQTLDATTFAVLVGPSSSGRNTIINRLVDSGEYHFIVSDTTRPPRVNDGVLEQDGVEYWFRTEEEMLADLKAGKFLEAEIIHRQQVSGVSIRELERAHAEHKIAITDVDIGGVNNVLRLKPDAVIILILPPSFDEWRRRITNRGHMTEEEWRRRLETAARIFSAPLHEGPFKIVVNHDVDDSAKQVNAIARTGVVDAAMQAEGVRVAAELLAAAQKLL